VRGHMTRVMIVIAGDLEVGEWGKQVLSRIGHHGPMGSNRAHGLCLLDFVAPDLLSRDVLLPEWNGLEAFCKTYGRPGQNVIAISERRDPRRASDAGEWNIAATTLHCPFTQAEWIPAFEMLHVSG